MPCAAPPSSSRGFLLTLLLSAYALETLKFSPGSIIAFRVAMVMILGALAGYFFVLPQWRRVTDEQVALYLEECEPTLETAILSALEAEKQSPRTRPRLRGGWSNRRSSAAASSSAAAASKRSRCAAMRPPSAEAIAAALLALRPRPGVSAAGRVGAAADGWRRARSQPVPHRREAGQHDRATRIRSGDRGDGAGLRVGQGRAAHPQIAQRAVRARADGLQQRHEDLRRHAVRSAGLDRLLRRVGRREVVGVHDARGRSAVREAARDGVRVPGVHGSRAAQDRKRRRHRRAAGHAGAAAHHADDEVARRAASCSTAARPSR